MDALECILTRRSVRQFDSNKKITHSEIEELLKAASYAPSAHNKQPWQFLVIEDKEIIKGFRQIQPWTSFAKDASCVIIICADTEVAFHREKEDEQWSFADIDRVRIGYIPTGSSNDMARDLQLPKDPLVILEQILACREPLKMDLGCLTYESISDQMSRQHSRELTRKRYFAVSAGIGYDAAVCEEALASKFKNVLNKIGLGKLTYLTIALKQLITTPKVTCEILLDEKTKIHLPKFLFVAGMIHKYEGGGFKFCPAADFQDGKLNICVVGNISKWLVLFALPTAFPGKHYRFEGIDHYTAEKLSIHTSAPLWVHTDGEVSMKSDAITITCEKEKIQLLK